MVRTFAAVAVVFLAGTCGPCSGTSPAAASKVHLVFTGPAPGTLTAANIDCHLFNNQTQFNALVKGKLGDKDLTFNIQVYSGYHGPDTYKVGTTLDGSANLRLQIGDWVGSSPSNAGTLIITDGKSGVVDANLGDFEHVTGNFVCAEVKTE